MNLFFGVIPSIQKALFYDDKEGFELSIQAVLRSKRKSL